jgi:hypothetical protein
VPRVAAQTAAGPAACCRSVRSGRGRRAAAVPARVRVLTVVALRAPYRRARGRANLAGRDHDAGPGRVFRSPGESARSQQPRRRPWYLGARFVRSPGIGARQGRGARREAIRPGRSRRSARRRVRPPARLHQVTRMRNAPVTRSAPGRRLCAAQAGQSWVVPRTACRGRAGARRNEGGGVPGRMPLFRLADPAAYGAV